MEAVIIGAGRTGRGFIAPILKQNNCRITFLDKDKSLIRDLNELTSYTVNYFNNRDTVCEIKKYSAFTTDEEAGIQALKKADIVFTSVYANNLNDLIDTFKTAINQRTKKEELIIVCCENGIDVKRPLIESNLKAKVSEGIIFCTTIEKENSMDLYSEPIFELPVDNSEMNFDFYLKGIHLTKAFNDLIQRKIYTYNFMSALIGYLGHYKNYSLLHEAANDEEIMYLINKTLPLISSAIAKEFNIPYKEQLEFTQRAISKFSNPEIPDSIYRNIIDVNRKLGINERLLKPLYFMYKYKESMDIILMVIASALDYGNNYEDIDLEIQYKRLSEIVSNYEVKRVHKILNWFENGESLSNVISYFEV